MCQESFEVRFGFSPAPVDLQREDFPPSLRNGLWDMVDIYCIGGVSNFHGFTKEFRRACASIWFHFYREPSDEVPGQPESARRYIRDKFFNSPAGRAYGFIEFMANLPQSSSIDRKEFALKCNTILERERSPFRFSETTLVQITDPEELKEVGEAMSFDSPASIREHIKKAAQHYSADAPDFRNSIKESISAVEAAVRIISGTKAVGVKPLRQEISNLAIHPALVDGFDKIYGYTSDEGGVRHSLMDQDNVTQSDARLMLVACSAFANFLMAKKIAIG